MMYELSMAFNVNARECHGVFGAFGAGKNLPCRTKKLPNQYGIASEGKRSREEENPVEMLQHVCRVARWLSGGMVL